MKNPDFNIRGFYLNMYNFHYAHALWALRLWKNGVFISDVAVLEVFIKPETQIFDDLTAVFSVNENKGDVWLSHMVLVEQIDQPFQVRLWISDHIQ